MDEPPQGPGVLALPLCPPKAPADCEQREEQSRTFPTPPRTTKKGPPETYLHGWGVVTVLEQKITDCKKTSHISLILVRVYEGFKFTSWLDHGFPHLTFDTFGVGTSGSQVRISGTLRGAFF